MSKQYRDGYPVGPDGMNKRERWNKKRRESRGTVHPTVQKSDPEERLAILELENQALKKQVLSETGVREFLTGLKSASPTSPRWTLVPDSSSHTTGVPTLFCSDWHWSEVVNSKEIGGVNSYNLDIAHTRAKELINRTIQLLRYQLNDPHYPGIVLALGGDMLSGDIHEELQQTNDCTSLKALVDLWGVLQWCIKTLADAFGNVYVPAVCGNHGRTTKKPRAKQKAHTNFDWLLYTMLADSFKDDPRICMNVAEGSDLYYKIYGHRYLLTHGDQFRGGDGQVGMLGPVIRGHLRKRNRQSQIHQEYDTLICGHWHQLCQMPSVIINGSLKGYDEYAWVSNFPFEVPQQALWITHPTHGITVQMPVKIETKPKTESSEGWVSWKTAG